MFKALTAMLICAALIAAESAVELPVIERLPAADWVNVTTLGAKGDGTTDDTVALQSALDQLHGWGSRPKTIYLPPGTFRITRTLEMPNSVGAMLLGHGAATRIVWDGKTEGSPLPIDAAVEGLRQNPHFPAKPDASGVVTKDFATPDDFSGDRFGFRLGGWLAVPADGAYTFTLMSDDSSELWLSPNADATKAVRIAGLDHAVGSWELDRAARSKPVMLKVTQRYAIHVLAKQKQGEAFAQVGWLDKEGKVVRRIAGEHLFQGPEATATRGLRWERWNDKPFYGDPKKLAALKANPAFPDHGRERQVMDGFELGNHAAVNYGTRFVAWVEAPANGEYRLTCSADDAAEVARIDADGTRQVLITIPSWTPKDDFSKPHQTSASFAMKQGERMQIELIHKQADGGDHAQLAWIIPGATKPTIITREHAYQGPAAEAKRGVLFMRYADPTAQFSRMLWVNGAANAVIEGIVFDGANKALVGVHHHARDRFECKTQYRHSAFINCRDVGLQMGPQNPYATSESEVIGCIFRNNDRGFFAYDFNFYNEVLRGCRFEDHRIAVMADGFAQVSVFDSQFRRSSESDLRLGGGYTGAIRGNDSEGSTAFLVGANAVLQSNRVRGWTGASAVTYWKSQPLLLLDNEFSGGKGTAVTLTETAQPVVMAGNRQDGKPLTLPGATVVGLPGAPVAAAPGLAPAPAKPTTLINADDFRHLSSEEADGDTVQVQATIDAAIKAGPGAIAWFPPREGRRYRITRPVVVANAGITIAGSGYHSEFQYDGPQGGAVFTIRDPRDLVVQDLQIISHSSPTNLIGIHQVAGSGPSRVTYRNLTLPVGWRDDARSGVRGLVLEGLGAEAVVDVERLNGSAECRNSADALVLMRFLDGGPLLLAGTAGAKARPVLVTYANGADHTQLEVRDSLDAVIGSLYIEQGNEGIHLRGSPQRQGRVTIGAARLHHWAKSPWLFRLDDWTGRLSYGFASVTFDQSPASYRIEAKGGDPTLVLLGHGDPKFTVDGIRRVVTAANGPGLAPAPDVAALSATLADWRALMAGIQAVDATR